jgi:uncharacterized membrane protein YgdD (TMEM256/DUF423 family)
MLIPGGVVTGNLLPWVLFAPVLPLLLLLLRKIHFNAVNTSLLLLCVVSVISNSFLLLAKDHIIQPSFIRFSFVAEFLFTGLLLKTCTDHQLLKYSIITTILVFLGIFTSFSIMGSEQTGMEMVMKTGVLIVFIISLLVLASKVNKLEEHIVSKPDFWFTAGIFFHFGLLSLLLLTAKKTSDIDYHEQGQFSVLYVIIFCAQFIFFSVGVLLPKPLDISREKNKTRVKRR